MANAADPNVSSIKQADLKSGKVIWNNTVYSGADITLLIHSSHKEIVDLYKNKLIESKENNKARIEERKEALAASSDPKRIPIGADFEEWRTQQISSIGDEIIALEDFEINVTKEIEELENNLTTASIPLATAHTLSVQTFREKFAVRACGFAQPKGFTRGNRTIGGSIIFTVFNEHALAPFLHYPPTCFAHERGISGKRAFIDQLPPMTISVRFANEFGSISELVIYGLEFVDDGMVMSIEDMFLENTCSYIARDYDILLNISNSQYSPNLVGGPAPLSASSLLQTQEYQDYKKRLDIKRNPYY